MEEDRGLEGFSRFELWPVKFSMVIPSPARTMIKVGAIAYQGDFNAYQLDNSFCRLTATNASKSDTIAPACTTFSLSFIGNLPNTRMISRIRNVGYMSPDSSLYLKSFCQRQSRGKIQNDYCDNRMVFLHTIF
jgi:hypothetical protein